jgi:protein SCO1/2
MAAMYSHTVRSAPPSTEACRLPMSRYRIVRTLSASLCAGLVLLAAACSRERATWHLASIRHLLPDLQFSLPSSGGGTLDAADVRGDVVLLYFGYTHCPDVCPLTLAKLKAALAELGPAAAHVRVLFVSVDPQRDTPETLQRYLKPFGPQFIGLVGTAAQTAALAKRYRVGYNKQEAPNGDQGDYSVTHSGGVFIFDPRGRALLLGTQGSPVAYYTADLKQLLSRR